MQIHYVTPGSIFHLAADFWSLHSDVKRGDTDIKECHTHAYRHHFTNQSYSNSTTVYYYYCRCCDLKKKRRGRVRRDGEDLKRKGRRKRLIENREIGRGNRGT